MMKALHTLLIILLASSLSFAITGDGKGQHIDVEYEEPNTNEDLTPLVDLSSTTVHWQIVGSTIVSNVDVPASSPTGGAVTQDRIDLKHLGKVEIVVEIWATASDFTGNVSSHSAHIQVPYDRLPPGKPK